ncbi:uncharacterized protein [Parasteatoda tepidariorum]|uniref:uncharacterized protein isoform X2 n=1 Tax=Parasteatoda tepidariorum TaxID=114398 RepID=UPI00077FD94A|nr:uncharacterized protein LOC107441864 isoform X4 [Parasteatoda tepidariorum]
MGACVTRCYNEARRWSCWQGNSSIEDRDRLVDEPAPRPLSISSWLSCVRGQLGFENEEVELQEEAVAIDAYNEAIKVKDIAEKSTELINPAKLAVDNVSHYNIERFYSVSSRSRANFGDVSINEKQKKDASCSSPTSSVDLEWETEQGLSPVSHMPGKDDISSDTTASCGSRASTPVSNGNEELEWDGHFTSTQISQLDMETERLITEIELLTTGALQEQTSNR